MSNDKDDFALDKKGNNRITFSTYPLFLFEFSSSTNFLFRFFLFSFSVKRSEISLRPREREREREREKEMKSRSEEQKGGNRAKKINKRAQKESDIQMRGVDNIEQKRRQKSESEKGTKSRWQ